MNKSESMKRPYDIHMHVQEFRITQRLTDNLSTSIVNSSCNCLSSSLCKKIIKESFLKSCRWHNAGRKVDESRYHLDSFVLPKITTKTMAHDEKQVVTSSASSSFLVSSLDFVSSFLSVAVSFSFFCSATGAMLELMGSEACTDSWDLLPSSLLCSFNIRAHAFTRSEIYPPPAAIGKGSLSPGSTFAIEIRCARRVKAQSRPNPGSKQAPRKSA